MLKATRKQNFEIALLLNEHCKKNADGFAEYADGWSDRRICDEISKRYSEPLAVSSVSDTRLAVIGKLRPNRDEPKDHNLEARLASLETRFAKICADLGVQA